MYVRFPLSLRNVEDLLHERGIGISYETVRAWWNKFGPVFASDIRKKRVESYRSTPIGNGIWMKYSSKSIENFIIFVGRKSRR